MQTRTAHNSIFSQLSSKVKDYKLLVKFRLNLTVVFSAAMAFAIASPGAIDLVNLLILCLGGFFVTGAANALNQVLEKDYDKMMKRTENRPLATGRMSVSEGVMAAGIMSLIGVTLLAVFNPLTAVLGMLSLISYAFIYTPMKRVSPVAVLIGAIPGALPMMIGVVAVQGELTPLAISLFAIQFLWQFPHFWAIAWLAHEDYTRAGFNLLPSKEKDGTAGYQSFTYALMLVPVGLMPWWMGITGPLSAVVVGISAIVYAFFGWKLWKENTRVAARKLMFSSFFYLPIVLIILLIDKI